nr:cytidylate kinase-like family protein [Prevotella sp.]
MIITIARLCGCGALHVGENLAKHYGIPFYTRQTLMQLARDKGVLTEMDDFFEERPVNELLVAISSESSDTGKGTNEKPLNILLDLIGTEDCIIIGRCGNYIFRNRADLTSVFLKGDLDIRIENIQKEKNLSLADARDFVDDADDCRVRYHKFYTGLRWGNASDYDICLDSCRLGTEHTAEMIERYIDITGSKNA